MENKLKTKAKKDFIQKGVFGFFVFSFLAAVIIYIVSVFTSTFNLRAVIYVIAVIVIITVAYIIRELLFIKKSKLTYGTIIRVEKSEPEDSQVYQNYIVEYMDKSINQKNETIVYEQYGDNNDDSQNQINSFFEEGQKQIGKKVPLLYLENNPKNTIVFMEMAESIGE